MGPHNGETDAYGASADADSDTSVSRLPTSAARRRYLVAFWITVAVVAVVVAMLPTALASMVDDLRGQDVSAVYDLFTGTDINADQTFAADTAFVNITVLNLDETRGVATLIVSGHRVCSVSCFPITATFYSLGSDTAQRRGLPPSAAVSAPGESGSYTFTIELPVRGAPQRYPFDDYTLLLGLVISTTFPDGTEHVVTSPTLVQNQTSLTLEDRVARLSMAPPVPVDPVSVRSVNDPVDFLLVDRLQWERPRHLRIVTVLLVILISASGLFALGLRSLHELVLGIGGIILGIWGVRSVVVQTPLPDVTLIDLILGFVILVLLLVLSMRAARYFYVQSRAG